MSAYGKDVCERCLTTHPLNEQNERVCPKPPIEINFDFVPAVIWKCGGSSRGYNGGGVIPKTDKLVPNPAHNPPTLGSLGLTAEQGRELGIS